MSNANTPASSNLGPNNIWALCLLISIILLLPLALPGTAYSQELSTESEQLRQSMDELIQFLKENRAANRETAELQRLQIAVTYLSFRSRRIEAKEQELERSKQMREATEDLIAKIEADPEGWDRFYKGVRNPKTITSSSEQRPSEYRIRILKERIEELDIEISNLEADINYMTSQLAELEGFVEDRLNLVR